MESFLNLLTCRARATEIMTKSRTFFHLQTTKYHLFLLKIVRKYGCAHIRFKAELEPQYYPLDHRGCFKFQFI